MNGFKSEKMIKKKRVLVWVKIIMVGFFNEKGLELINWIKFCLFGFNFYEMGKWMRY